MKKLNMKIYNNKTSNVQTSNISYPTSNAGITLIALIITIIVLLILAGVTLNMVMGDSGIFRKANKASKETNEKQAIETVKIALLSARMEYTLNKDLDVKDYVEKENKEIAVDQTGTGEALDLWDMTYNGYTFNIKDLKIEGWSKGKNNPKAQNIVVTENYQFTTTVGNKAKVEFEIELPEELEGATVAVTPKTTGKGTVAGEYKDGKYTGTITTNGTDNPNGEYTYEIKATKGSEEKTANARVEINKFLDDPTIEIVEDSIKYDRFIVKATSNYPTDAGIKYKYYVTNTTADFETATTKEITELEPQTEYTVKVEVYLSDESDKKEVTTKVTTLEKLVEIDSIEDLEKISEDLAGSYKLIKSLDFKDRNSYETQEKYEYYTVDSDGDGNPDNSWIPIGNNSTQFKGKFDGQYYKITNLYVRYSNFVGLFGEAYKATFNRLYLENVDVGARNYYYGAYTGGLVGSAKKCSLSEIGVSGEVGCVSSWETCGLIVGRAENATTLDKCFADGTSVSYSIYNTKNGYQSLIGSLYEASDSITNSYGKGGQASIGLTVGKGKIENCYSRATATIGLNDSSTDVTSSFWNQEDSGSTSSSTGEEKTKAEMQTQSTYTSVGWDFNTIWEMDSETGYPKLQWEKNLK